MSSSEPSHVASPIVVGVRVRPFNQREARFQSQCVVGMDASGVVKLMQVSSGKLTTTQAPREFTYDHAFWTHDRNTLADSQLCGPGVVFADQAYVYDKMATPVVDNVMNGFNACLFAYGQTGSGKTYSMMGTPSDRGVLPRLGEAMFEKIAALKEGSKGASSSSEKTLCAVEASFCEIYNEKVRDLMTAPAIPESGGGCPAPPPPVNLPIRLDPKKGVFVEGLTKYAVSNADDFYVFLENGLSSRAVGSTNMNNTSSRSHAIVILTVSQTGPKGEKCGKLCLVDLAGSERVSATGATGQTAAEGQSINLSLTQLGICLKRLAEQAEAAAAASGKKTAAALPIPYRDSALTFLLKENLGGNSRTAMLANISPASVNFDETLATLRFAQIARKVKSVATVNENPQTKLIVQLREELAQLRARFQHLEARKSTGPASQLATPSVSADRPPERLSTTLGGAPEVLQRSAVEDTGPNESCDLLLVGGGSSGASATRAAADSPDLDVLLQEVVQQQQHQQHRRAQRGATPTDSIHLTSSDDEAGGAGADEDIDLLSDDVEEEIRSLEALRNQSKSFVYHHHPSAVPAGLNTPLMVNDATAAGVLSTNHSMASNAPLGPLAMSSPSFKLNLSRLTSSRGPPSQQHVAPLSCSSGAMHDTDLDDLMSDAASRKSLVPTAGSSSQPRFTDGGGAGGLYRFNDDTAKEINNSFTLAQQQRTTSAIAGGLLPRSTSSALLTRNVFLDARKPQLIHLNPDTMAHSEVPLVMVLEEGENIFDIGGAHVVFVWDALGNQVILFGTPAALAVNGEQIEDEGTILRHRDRVVVLGVLAFRFSFAAGVLAQEGGFNKVAECTDHLVRLEKYYRNTLLLERSRDAMSIAKAYVYQTASLKEVCGTPPPPGLPTSIKSRQDEDDRTWKRQSVNITRIRSAGGSDSPASSSPIDDDVYQSMSTTPRGVTPRSSDPTLAAIGNDIGLYNEIIYKLEVELAEDYPLPEEALADVAGDADGEQTATYAEAIAEVQRNQQDQERELEWLRAQVQHAGTRLERETTFHRVGHQTAAEQTPAGGIQSRSLSHFFHSPTAADRALHFFDVDDAAMEHSTGDPTPASMSPNHKGDSPGHSFDQTNEEGDRQRASGAAAAAASAPHEVVTATSVLALSEQDVLFEQQVGDQLTTRIVQLELAYHRRVRALQLFSRSGPKNPDDKEVWELLYTNPPFLGDPSLQCEQSCYCLVRDHWSGIGSWTQRFVSASRTYLFVFKKADGRERCLAAIYLPGATLAKLNDTDVEVCPACPRHVKDTKTGNPKDAAIVLRFRDAAEHDLWREWFVVQVCPIPVPHHMLKRQVEERAIALAASASPTELYADDAQPQQQQQDGTPSPKVNHRRASIAAAAGAAAIQRVDQLSGTANWKPDQSSHSCEKCAKDFTFFRRRHHCRGCGGIFCSDCLEKSSAFGNQLSCKTCREEHMASPGTPRNHRKASKKQLRATTTLTTANQAAVVARDTYSSIVLADDVDQRLVDSLVEDFAVFMDQDATLTRVRVDHFQGRFHTILADDLVSVCRCPLNGCRLNIRYKNVVGATLNHLGSLSAPQVSTVLLSTPSSYTIGANVAPAVTHTSSKSIYFQNASSREKCFESIWVLLSNRVFIDALESARMVWCYPHADLVIKDDAELSLIRTTSQSTVDVSVWVGIESTRPIPFHHGFALYAVLGFQETWSERQLEHYSLYLVSSLRLGRKKPTLFLIAHQNMRSVIQGQSVTAQVVRVHSSCIGGAEIVVSAVGIRIFDSSFVFIPTNFFEYSSSVCGDVGQSGAGGGNNNNSERIAAQSQQLATSATSGSTTRPAYLDPSVAMAASTSLCLHPQPSMSHESAAFNEIDAASEFSLRGLQMSSECGQSTAACGEPCVDLLQWYDHAFLVGAPDMSSLGFHRKTISESSLVQVRTTVGTSMVLKRSGRTWSQFLVPALNVHVAKFSACSGGGGGAASTSHPPPPPLAQEERPLITLKGAILMDSDGSNSKDVTEQCELWGQQLGFDRFDHESQKLLHDPRAHYLRPVMHEASDEEAGARAAAVRRASALRTVVLANTLVDYLMAKCIRMTIPGVASCVVHMAAIPEGTTSEMTLEGTWDGEVVGIVKATFEYRMIPV